VGVGESGEDHRLVAGRGRDTARDAWLIVIASVWILAAGVGAAVLGAWISDATCNDAEEGSLACGGAAGTAAFFSFVVGVFAGWLTTWLAWRRLPRARGWVLLVASILVISGVVPAFTVTNDNNPSPSPTFEFGPGDALP
jgi:MFS family permease